MKQKIQFQKKEDVDEDHPLMGMKNYHLEKSNNVWGQSFIVIYDLILGFDK